MLRKFLSILVCMLLIATTFVNIPTDVNVKASGEGEGESEYLLDLDYIWWLTGELCNVTYDAYGPGEIPRGRFFGSKGGNYTVHEILKPEMDIRIGLENVKNLSIGDLESTNKEYTTVMWVNDFSLEINHVDYDLTNLYQKKRCSYIQVGIITII